MKHIDIEREYLELLKRAAEAKGYKTAIVLIQSPFLAVHVPGKHFPTVIRTYQQIDELADRSPKGGIQ